MTFFQFVPKDLDKYDPKPFFEVEVSGSNTVADFHSKLTEMNDLRDSDFVAEYYRDGFNVGEKLKCDEKIEDGATVYVVFTTKKKLKEVEYDTRYKDVKSEFDDMFDDFIKNQKK